MPDFKKASSFISDAIDNPFMSMVGVTEGISSDKRKGVRGFSKTNIGVEGTSEEYYGVYGSSDKESGIYGTTKADGKGGVIGVASTANSAGVYGENLNGYGVVGKGPIAGFFLGNVEVTGDVRLKNADCAEDFDIACLEKVEPGTVMVIDSEGALRQKTCWEIKQIGSICSIYQLYHRNYAASR